MGLNLLLVVVLLDSYIVLVNKLLHYLSYVL